MKIFVYGFFKTYRLLLPNESPVHHSLNAEEFDDRYSAQRFVRYLEVSNEQWLRILWEAHFPAEQSHERHPIIEKATDAFYRGIIKAYALTGMMLSHRTTHQTFINVPHTKPNTHVHFAPSGIMLIQEHGHTQTFNNRQKATDYVEALGLNTEQLQLILSRLNLTFPLPQNVPHAMLMRYLISALSEGEAVAIEKPVQHTPPPKAQKEPETLPAIGPGNRPTTLGPHEGLHNQEWDKVDVKDQSFKTTKQVDMDNLAEDEVVAHDELKRQGWDDDKVEQIINSGHDFQTKKLNKGDTLYGFDTTGREKNIKNSAYWLDESGFQEVQAKYFKNGQWDKEGVKNYLALPCFNRASDISTVKLTQDTTVIESQVAKARELIQYTDKSGYTTGTLGKIMGGGGSQITANPTLLAKI